MVPLSQFSKLAISLERKVFLVKEDKVMEVTRAIIKFTRQVEAINTIKVVQVSPWACFLQTSSLTRIMVIVARPTRKCVSFSKLKLLCYYPCSATRFFHVIKLANSMLIL